MAIVPSSSSQSLEQEQEDTQLSKDQAFSEFLITELNKRYDLRPRAGPGRPPKATATIEPTISLFRLKPHHLKL